VTYLLCIIRVLELSLELCDTPFRLLLMASIGDLIGVQIVFN